LIQETPPFIASFESQGAQLPSFKISSIVVLCRYKNIHAEEKVTLFTGDGPSFFEISGVEKSYFHFLKNFTGFWFSNRMMLVTHSDCVVR
jgi:hypothetical protein